MKYLKKNLNNYNKILVFILFLPIVCASQNSNNLLPKWIKFDNLDAVVISIPQMDSITVKLLERDFYKKKVETNRMRFDILVLEIESLTYQLNHEVRKNRNLQSIIIQKDFQIKTLNEQRTLDKLNKPSFWKKLGDFSLLGIATFIIGVIAGVAIVI